MVLVHGTPKTRSDMCAIVCLVLLTCRVRYEAVTPDTVIESRGTVLMAAAAGSMQREEGDAGDRFRV
eukprot:353706-Chlamydomonas_euryale.AAC.7